MKRLDYLKFALELELYKTRAWVIKAFSITKPGTKSNTPGDLIIEPWGYSFIDREGNVQKIEDAAPNAALFTFKERIAIDNTWVPNIQEPTETCIGNVIFNWICILSSFGSKHPFPLGSLSVGALENKIAPKLKDTPAEGEERSSTHYYVDEYVKFVDALQFISSFSQLATVSATAQNTTAPKGIEEFKAKLVAKYGASLSDPVSLAKFDAELLAFDNEYLKDDPANGTFTAGKIKHTARKKMFLSLGAGLQFTDKQTVTPIINSLQEGWPTDPEGFAAAMNDSRVGSFSRGAETVKGGVSAKYLLRSANNFKIADTDCGSTLGVKRLYDKSNVSQLEGRYILNGTKLTFVENIAQVDDYLNQEVIVRSPMYCKLPGDNICKICSGSRLAKFPTGLTIPLTEISNTILTASLKAMHQNTTATARLRLESSLS